MNRLKKKITFLLLCCIVVVTNCTFSPVNAQANEHMISGYIAPDFNLGNPAGFLVELLEGSIQAVSDSNGYFELAGVPDNSSGYTVKISKDSYLSRQINGIKVTGNPQLGSQTEPLKIWAGDMKIKGVQDNAINMSDIVEVSRHFNSSYGDGEKYSAASDLNSDKAVNMKDIIIIANHFNKSSADYPEATINYPTPAKLKVSFIYVGKGDSIFIETPGGKSMLVDAGHDYNGNSIVSYIRSAGFNKLDVLVGTHPHNDHIGGMSTVIDSLEIGRIYLPEVPMTSDALDNLHKAITNKGLKVDTAIAGVSINLDPDLKIDMLAPKGEFYESINNYSAVIKITYKNTSFLLSGDANTLSEAEMLAAGYDLKADVLKVGHHGSLKSTSAEYLEAVSPKYAVISVGPNDSGNPKKATLDKLAAANIKVYRTDIDGTITATSDGNTVVFN